MTVKELIEELQKFPEDSRVTITDGYLVNCYDGEYSIKEYEDEGPAVDIGIGGTKVN